MLVVLGAVTVFGCGVPWIDDFVVGMACGWRAWFLGCGGGF